jgi:hypothetical protein
MQLLRFNADHAAYMHDPLKVSVQGNRVLQLLDGFFLVCGTSEQPL